MSRPFRFKRFTVVQDRSAMKVGTDGVLLGAWCGIEPADRYALDIGTGTGVIALMLAQRGESNPLCVDAVEIDPCSACEAGNNVRNSPWAERIKVITGSVQDFTASAERRYDLIVCNPPYFIGSLLSPDPARTTARHTVSMSYEELTSAVSDVLSEHGRFCVVIPHDHKVRFIGTALRYGLSPRRVTSVLPKPGLLPKRALVEFVREGYATGQLREDELLIETGVRHEYSPEYMALTSAFYLKF